jgi:hypothetical protein
VGWDADWQAADDGAVQVELLDRPQRGAGEIAAALDGEQLGTVGICRVVGPSPAVGQDGAGDLTQALSVRTGNDDFRLSHCGFRGLRGWPS